VLRDALRKYRELVGEIDLAQCPAARRNLCRRLLRELEQLVVTLVDDVEALGKRDQRRLVVDHVGRVFLDYGPSGDDVVQQGLQHLVAGDIETNALNVTALGQHIEVATEAIPGVLNVLEGGNVALDRKRRPPRETLRKHLHFGRGGSAGGCLRCDAGIQEKHEQRQQQKDHQQHAENLELANDRKMAYQPQTARLAYLRVCGAHLFHDRHRRKRIVGGLPAHLGLRRRLVE